MGINERPAQPAIRQFGGLNTRDSEIGLTGSDSPDMMNVDLHPNGSVKMRKGMSVLTAPALETKVDAVMRLDKPEDSRGFLYVVAGGVIYRTIEPGSWSWGIPTSTGSLTLTTQNTWGRANARYNNGTEYPSCLYICRNNGAPIIAKGFVSLTNDLDVMVQLAQGDGTPLSGILGYPSTWGANHWPTHMRLMSRGRGSRMHAWGIEDDPNRIYYTALDIPYHYGPDDIDSAAPTLNAEVDGGYYYVNRGDGDKVVSVVDMYGYTVIFKKNRTYFYTGDPGDAGGFYWTPIGEIPVGCVGDRAWQKVGNDILFWSEDGPRKLSTVQEYGDLEQANTAYKISDQVVSIAPGNFDRICSYHDVKNLRVIWFVPTSGATHNNTAYVYYYATDKWAKWDSPFCEVMDVERITANEQSADRVIAGHFDQGMVLLQSGFYDGADDISSYYVTNWINAGDISDGTALEWLDVMFGDDGPQVEVYYQIDLNSEWLPISRITKQFGGSGTAWGLFEWNSSAWGDTARAMLRYEAEALFNLIRFKFSKTSHYGFEVMGYRPELRQKGPRV